MKFPIKIIIGSIAVIFAFCAIQQLFYPNFFKFIVPKDVSEIDKTDINITDIKKIAQLFAVEYVYECVIDSFEVHKETKSAGNYFSDAMNYISDKKSEYIDRNIEREYVLIARGTINAGFDLSKIDSTKIRTEGDTVIYFTLPPSEILNVIVNPSDMETFYEQGTWKFEERQAIQSLAKNKLLSLAIENNILKSAEEIGAKNMKAFLKTLRFKEVNVLLSNQ